MIARRALAGAALLLGVLAPFVGEPRPAGSRRYSMDVQQLAAEVVTEQDHVTAIELAIWIRDRKQGLRVVDLRSAEQFDEYHLPGAEQMSLESLVRTRFRPDETLVLYSQGGAHAAQGWVFLRSLGHRRVYFLSGGLDEWVEDVMNPVVDDSPESARIAALSRYFGGMPRRGDPNRAEAKASVTQLRRRGC